ncbi:MAG: tripartite tricarboxylate transporter substrate binding protein [Rickettsiales bacterium]|jgi:tripartite-type tricarboxylate transporter receptor subunit TctC|nr:tripartite tricarboxylate transporter substrate binding protein [Rickettsiales bacterium]
MDIVKKLFILLNIFFFVILFCSSNASAAWPERPIRIIVAFPAGGGADTFIRYIAPLLEKELGQKIIINNIPGAYGGTGTAYVWDAPHDGYTWSSLGESHTSIVVVTGSKIIAKDWHYAIAGGGPSVLAVNKSSGINNLNEFITAAESTTGVTVATANTTGLLSIEQLKRVKPSNIKGIPYSGGAPAKLACASGETQGVLLPLGEYYDYIQAGDFIPIVVITQDEDLILGDLKIPPLVSVIPQWKSSNLLFFQGIMLPVDTPTEILEKFDAAFTKAMQTPEIDSFIRQQFWKRFAITGKEATDLIVNQERVSSWLMQDLGMAQYSPQNLGIEKPE